MTNEIAKKLLPIFEATNGEQGYVCAQVNPSKSSDREAMMAMAFRLYNWMPNIAVKITATSAGLDVVEDCSSIGMTVTATVSFTLPQVLAIGEKYQKGLEKCRASGKKPGRCFAVIMVGRIDDYIRDVVRDNNIDDVCESDIIQCGIAIMKKALEIYSERGYEAILMPAGMRGSYHVEHLSGSDIIMSIHPKIQKLLHQKKCGFIEKFSEEVDPKVIKRLKRISEFNKAFEVDLCHGKISLPTVFSKRRLLSLLKAGIN